MYKRQIFTEIFQDAVLYPAPINHWEAEEMISSLKSSRLLAGYRGQPPLDIKALADCLVSVSRLAEDYREKLVEMDINPVFVYPEGKGVKAADGLMAVSYTHLTAAQPFIRRPVLWQSYYFGFWAMP